MLRKQPCLAFVTLCLLAPLALAQQTPPAPPPAKPQTAQPQPSAPAKPAPQLERIEPGSDVPTTTIPPREGTKVIEKRGNDGLVKEVEVQAGPSHYTMKPNAAPGTAQPGQAPGNSIRAPQWQVMEFDIGNPKKQDTKDKPVRPAGPQKGAQAAKPDPAAPQVAPKPVAPKPAAPITGERAEVPPPPALAPTPRP